jgi:hypothetical protein
MENFPKIRQDNIGVNGLFHEHDMQLGPVIPKNRQVVGHMRICQQHMDRSRMHFDSIEDLLPTISLQDMEAGPSQAFY